MIGMKRSENMLVDVEYVVGVAKVKDLEGIK